MNSKKTTAGIPNTMTFNNIIGLNGREIAQLFADFFKQNVTINQWRYTSISTDLNIHLLKFSVDDVFEKLISLDCNKAARPDKILLIS